MGAVDIRNDIREFLTEAVHDASRHMDPRPLAERMNCGVDQHRELAAQSDDGLVEVIVARAYAAQRKPVASGRGASGLAGRGPDGSSSL